MPHHGLGEGVGGTCGNVIFSLATPSLVLDCKQWHSLHPTANYPVGRLTYFCGLNCTRGNA